MKRLTLACLLAGLVAFSIGGCEQRQQPSGKVGIGTVDRDNLNKELGWTEAVNGQIKNDQDFATAQINELKLRLDQAIAARKEQIGKTIGKPEEVLKTNDPAELAKLGVSKDQLEQLASAFAQANQLLQQVQLNYRQILTQRGQELDHKYGMILRPSVRKVAEDMGLATVWMVPSDNLLFSDRSLDITDQVCEAVRKSGETAPTLPPMQPIKFTEQAPASQPGATTKP